MAPLDLEAAARAAEAAADRARAEILPRFRAVATETKADGSPVTEADRAAEQAIRAVLREAFPDFAILGEEFGAEGEVAEGPAWVVDPIDGTIGFARGIPLASTIIALLEDGEPVLGLIDLPMLGERTVGWRGAGVRRNGEPVRCSDESDLARALVAHGDVFCFEACGERAAFERMSHECGMLRGYTDAFGHAQVVAGGVDAMVDLHLNPWDAAATRILVPEAGGRCLMVDGPAPGKLGLVFGSPALAERLSGFLAAKPR
ncbi:MAG TPA: inositol monophosphatase family protein [Myxococcota bacterium]|nr:inositol monophosphatase family protein [Myxococcota bacterium]